MQYKVKEVVKDNWDVFCEDILFGTIPGFSFQTDTGKNSTIYYKITRYSPHVSEAMNNLVQWLDKNRVAEEDNRPWGSLMVLDEKPHQ